VPEAELITTAPELEQLAERLLRADAVAVDTEFFWERTFFPILGLVQLATADGACWLIDTVRLKDIRALGPVMASPSVTKVLHDAPQDLGILARATGSMPRTIFDTRLAAGFAGFGATCSLQALLRQALGIELSKAETRSDWLRRPLSANQLRYAADDVLHLLALRERLLAGCASDTVRGWLSQDLARLDDEAAYQDRDPRLMFLRVKGGSRLSAGELAVLRELAAWRETEARQRDWPRGHVLPDDLLVTLAQRAPADLRALAGIPDLPRNMPEAVTADLLAAVSRGLAVTEADCPQPATDDLASKRALKSKSDRLLAQISTACATHNIDPALAASRAEAESYLQRLAEGSAADHPLAQGWRKTLLTQTLLFTAT
jgi:ribonuclease D